jgi:hypothetical protein
LIATSEECMSSKLSFAFLIKYERKQIF